MMQLDLIDLLKSPAPTFRGNGGCRNRADAGPEGKGSASFGPVNQPVPPKYPDRSGWKEPTTSREAADAIEQSGNAGRLRKAVVDALLVHGPMTPDECAVVLGEMPLSIRPRFTENAAAGLIFETGETRKNASGKRAKVWTA